MLQLCVTVLIEKIFFILRANEKHINGALTKYSYSCSGKCGQCFLAGCTQSSAVINSCVTSVNVGSLQYVTSNSCPVWKKPVVHNQLIACSMTC